MKPRKWDVTLDILSGMLALMDKADNYFLTLKGWSSVFKLIRIGLAAACIQSIVAVAAAILFALVMHNGIVGVSADVSNNSGIPQAMELHVPILRYTYLLLALGTILTHSRWTEIATEDVRIVSNEVNPLAPRRVTASIFGQLMIVTICFGIAVFRTPPYFLGATLNFLESKWLISALWSGAMSVVMVAFGVSTVAAKKAMQEPQTPRR